MNKIKLFAPCDGEVQLIEKIKDEIFSKKTLGDGFYISVNLDTETIELTSCFEQSTIELITDTKHALYLKSNFGPIALIHIGLDSNKYSHSTFEKLANMKDVVTLKNKLIKFKSEFFKSQNLKCDIPVVFDPEESKGWEIKLSKTGTVKQGEEIGYLEYKDEKDLSEQVKEVKKVKDENKWVLAAHEMLDIVGRNNFERVANCMTRVRFYVLDKEKINLDAIQAIEVVKGYAWSGNELQIVVGGNSYKVKDAVENIMSPGEFDLKANSSQNKKSLWQKILGAINGVIVPLMPLLIATGLLSGLSALLSNIGVINGAPPEGGFVTDMDMLSGIFYIMSNTGLALLAIFFCYSTVKYLGGDPVIAILIGLTIASRYFMTFTGVQEEWVLFSIDGTNISIKAYNNNLLPAVGAGVLYFHLDKFIKKWMPGVVDIIFRPFLAYTITVFVTFFLIAPILGLVELGISNIAIAFYEIPFGIGGLILGLIWQPIVFIGMGWPVWLAIDAEYFTNQGVLRGLPIMDGAAIAMIGVVLVMALKAKNKNDASNAYGSIMPLIFGITEPAMYGVTSTKGKPFWIACIGAGVTGMLLSLFSITRENIGGYGFLGVLGHTDLKDIMLYVSFALIGLVVNFVLTWFFYQDKTNDLSQFKKANRTLTRFIKYNSNKEFNIKNLYLENNLNEISNKYINEDAEKELIKKWMKAEKIRQEIEYLESKNEKLKAEIYTDMEKAKVCDISKYERLRLKFENSKLDTKINILKTKYEEANKEIQNEVNKFKKDKNMLETEIFKVIVKYESQLNNGAEEFKKLYFNQIYGTLIYIGSEKSQNFNLPKSSIYNTNSKWRLLIKL